MLFSGSDNCAADIDAFLAETCTFDTTKTVKEACSQIAVIGENMNIRRFAQMKERRTVSLLPTHIWVERSAFLLDVETDVVNDAVKEMAKNVAMQVAALKPLYFYTAK